MTVHGFLALAVFLGVLSPVHADRVHVAVASNFSDTVRQIAEPFMIQTGHELRISAASTGKLYAQITHGAPFDVFLAADEHRPELLSRQGLAVTNSLYTYALGQLVLWGPSRPDRANGGRDLLATTAFDRLAIANPKTAPYGAAAREVLEQLAIWDQLNGRLVRGENIGQTFQFIASGAADLGFVALSQLNKPGIASGYQWLVPPKFYRPIRQRAVLLASAADKQAAREFMEFLRSKTAADIIRANGYGIEESPP